MYKHQCYLKAQGGLPKSAVSSSCLWSNVRFAVDDEQMFACCFKHFATAVTAVAVSLVATGAFG